MADAHARARALEREELTCSSHSACHFFFFFCPVFSCFFGKGYWFVVDAVTWQAAREHFFFFLLRQVFMREKGSTGEGWGGGKKKKKKRCSGLSDLSLINAFFFFKLCC